MATAPNTTPDPQARRAAIRRARSGGGGFGGGGGSSTSDSYTERNTAADEDEVDQSIDPTEPRNNPPRLPAPGGPEGGTTSPRARLQRVAMAGSPGYAKEYRLQFMARLLMRGVHLDVIADQLEVSISTAERYRAELKARFRQMSKELNIDEMVGTGIAFYDEVSAKALRMSEQDGVPTAMRLAAMRTSLAASADKTRFLVSTGVFDALRFKVSEDQGQMSDVQALMARTMAALSEIDSEEASAADRMDDDAPAQRTRRTRRARQNDGFKEMTWNDPDATGSAQEVEQI